MEKMSYECRVYDSVDDIRAYVNYILKIDAK